MLVVITKEVPRPQDAQAVNLLAERGVGRVHLRFPQAGEAQVRAFIEAVHPRYRSRLVLCSHYRLLAEYPLGGLYLSPRLRAQWQEILQEIQTRVPLTDAHTVAVGAHSFNELTGLPFTPRYALLSPVWDSISKEGYRANPDLLGEKARERLAALPFPVLAMGGVTPQNYRTLRLNGYAGAALLGSIWQGSLPPPQAYSQFPDPEILSLAGHDPTGGAGLVADALTAALYGVRCYTVATCLTRQNARAFAGLSAADTEECLLNIRSTVRSTGVQVAKVGMVPDLQSLHLYLRCLRQEGVRYIIWDPVTLPSQGTTAVLQKEDGNLLEEIFSLVDLITPNAPEAALWLGINAPQEAANWAQRHHCAVLLKGGHSIGDEATVQDTLFTPDGTRHPFTLAAHRDEWGAASKHGTGCMLSAAIASLLACGETLPAACRRAQRYVAQKIASNPSAIASVRLYSRQDKEQRLHRSLQLQYITNTSDPQLLYHRCRTVLEGGCRWIQLRLKEADTSFRVQAAQKLLPLCRRYGATLIIDDDVQAVLRSGAHGVHLGATDASPLEARRILGSQAIIGYTCHNIPELAAALRYGVDYIGVGPYRDTQTKQVEAPVLGLDGIKALMQHNQRHPYPIPAVAIGGITVADIPQIIAGGVQGVAVSGSIDRSPHPEEYCRALLNALQPPKADSPPL